MRCSALLYAALLLLCSATCDGARPWAAKGGSANDEASARPQVRKTRDAAKTPIRPRDAIVRKLMSTADAPPAMRGTMNTEYVLCIHLAAAAAAAAITTHAQQPSISLNLS